MRLGCWSEHPGEKRCAHSRKSHCIERDSSNTDAGWASPVSQASSFGVPNLAGGGFIMLHSCLFYLMRATVATALAHHCRQQGPPSTLPCLAVCHQARPNCSKACSVDMLTSDLDLAWHAQPEAVIPEGGHPASLTWQPLIIN